MCQTLFEPQPLHGALLNNAFAPFDDKHQYGKKRSHQDRTGDDYQNLNLKNGFVIIGYILHNFHNAQNRSRYFPQLRFPSQGRKGDQTNLFGKPHQNLQEISPLNQSGIPFARSCLQISRTTVIFATDQILIKTIRNLIVHAVDIDGFSLEAVHRAAHNLIHAFKLFPVAQLDFIEH